MPIYKTSSQLKDTAKDFLAGKYGTAILLLFAGGGIAFFLSFFGSMLLSTIQVLCAILSGEKTIAEGGGTIAASYFIAFVLSLFTGILNFGVTLFYLKAACGRRCGVSDLFYGFRYSFGKVFCINAVFSVLQALCFYPVQIFRDLYRLDQEKTFLWIALATGLLGILIYIPVSLALSQTYLLMLDFPQYGWTELLRLSPAKMKGHKRRLFLIECSFLPLYLLGIFSLGVGLFWVLPLRNMTRTLFYLDLMNPSSSADSAASEEIR